MKTKKIIILSILTIAMVPGFTWPIDWKQDLNLFGCLGLTVAAGATLYAWYQYNGKTDLEKRLEKETEKNDLY